MSPKAKGLRERKKQEKLARIENAARELFSEHGYERTTTRAIAERAGIGTGTLFVYFPEKRDLLFHLFSSAVRKVKEDAFAAVPDGKLTDRLMFVFERFFDYYGQDPKLSLVFVKEMGFNRELDRTASGSLLAELLQDLAGLISDAQRTGEVDRRIVPFAAAFNVFALYFMSLVSWLGGGIPSRDNQLAMLRNGLHMFYNGLAPRPV